jgi:hypothetical protein
MNEWALPLGMVVVAALIVCYADARKARKPLAKRIPVSVPDDREREPWQGEPEEAVPEYFLPSWRQRLLPPSRVRALCPKCSDLNHLRAKQDPPLEPLPSSFRVRHKDGTVWCVIHDEAFGGSWEAFMASITVTHEGECP